MAELPPTYPTMTLAGIQKVGQTNSDPIKDFNDEIGLLNSPEAGLSGPD